MAANPNPVPQPTFTPEQLQEMTPEQHTKESLIALAAHVRDLQDKYFTHRTPENLKSSKHWEKVLDLVCRPHKYPPPPVKNQYKIGF